MVYSYCSFTSNLVKIYFNESITDIMKHPVLEQYKNKHCVLCLNKKQIYINLKLFCFKQDEIASIR